MNRSTETTGAGERPVRIGSFDVQRELGRGGMGVVYLARDPSLLRNVAVKVLPGSLTLDPARSARFEREARLLASINHPNIAVVYSLERTAEGAVFLVMEYIDGESLAERVRRGPLPVAEALEICRRVAKALEAAHSRGVVHRDLKPPNVMIGQDGIVKVLDFGLAVRLTPDDPAGAPNADPETLVLAPGEGEIATSVTLAGEVLGTPGYLSPEQALGLPAGRGADLFAFGCLLFECLAGRRAFAGTTTHELLAATVRGEPDWSLLPADTPAVIRAIIGRCLAKEAAHRPPGMAEVRLALEEAMERPPSVVTGRRHNLPRELSSFVGREQEISQILELQRAASLLTLTGAGGCGKTRLALRAAQALLPDFADGVWLAELAALSDPARLPAAVVSVLELRASPGESAEKVLIEGIGSKSLLLILDNCEHLVEASAMLARELLEACPGLKIMATSREILGVSGETSFRVPSLAMPAPDDEPDEGDLIRYEACRLFLERARSANPSFQLGGDEARCIARICRRLDGIPLAIELAAARTRLLPVQQIEIRLKDRFRLLTGGSRTTLERQQTLRATLDWSYALLTNEERLWLRRLSVFVGGWSVEGAIALAGGQSDEIEVVDLLTHLVDKSLVIAEPEVDPPRHRMLEMVRQYAREKCDQEGEGAVLRDRHLDYYIGLIDRARAHLFGGPQQKRWLDLLEAEHGNFQAAVHWSEEVEGGEVKGLKLVALLAQFWYLRGHGQVARSLLLSALGRRQSPAVNEDEWLNWRAGALNAAAHFLTAEGDVARARALIEEAIEVRRRIGPRLDLARVLFTLGANLRMEDRFAEARRAHEEALALAREEGHRDMVAALLNALGADVYDGGDRDDAAALFEASLALRRELQDLPNAALVLNNLGVLAGLRGDLDQAQRYQEEALSIHRELKNLSGIAGVLAERGSIWVEMGQPEAALQDFAEALEIARRLGENPRIAGLYVRVAALHLRDSRPALAVPPLRQALTTYRDMGSTLGLTETLMLVSVLAAGMEEFAAAARLFGVAQASQVRTSLQALPGELTMIAESQAAVRASLGDDAYAAGVAAGSGLSLVQAAVEAMALVDDGAAPGRLDPPLRPSFAVPRTPAPRPGRGSPT